MDGLYNMQEKQLSKKINLFLEKQGFSVLVGTGKINLQRMRNTYSSTVATAMGGSPMWFNINESDRLQLLIEVFENQPVVSTSVLPKPLASSPPPIGKPCNPKNPKSRLPEYVCNPETGRWVKRTGATGIEVVKKYGL